MSGIASFRRKPPPGPVAGPAILGWVITDGSGRLTRADYYGDRADAERELAQWQKQIGGQQWQLAEIRVVT